MSGMTGIKGHNIEIAVYRGEEVLCMGTLNECAKKLKVKPGTLYFYLMPSYARRVAKRKRTSGNTIVVVRT